MPIEIKQLHIKSSVTQRAGAAAPAASAAAPAAASPAGSSGCDDGGGGDGGASSGEREQTLAECRRMIRDAMRELRER